MCRRHLEDIGSSVSIENVIGPPKKFGEGLTVVAVTDQPIAGAARDRPCDALQPAAGTAYLQVGFHDLSPFVLSWARGDDSRSPIPVFATRSVKSSSYRPRTDTWNIPIDLAGPRYVFSANVATKIGIYGFSRLASSVQLSSYSPAIRNPASI